MFTRAEFKENFINVYGHSLKWRECWREYRDRMIKEGWGPQNGFPSPCGTHTITKWFKKDMITLTEPADLVIHDKYSLSPFKKKGLSPKAVFPYGAVAATTQESTMQHFVDVRVDASAPKADDKTRYLLDRLVTVKQSKKQPLAKQFNLYVNNSPKTFKDLIDAIKEGKYTIDKKVEKSLAVSLEEAEEFGYDDPKEAWGYNPMHGIIWDGPQPDRKGYDAAIKRLDEAAQKVRDDINVFSPEEGLKALRAFEELDITTATAQ